MTGTMQGKKLQTWIAICLLIACVCVPLVSRAEPKVYEGPGQDTPEDAVALYLQGFMEQDMEKMISAYAVETYVDHFDLQAQIARMRMYHISMTPRMPNTGDLLRAINIESRRGEIVQSVLWQMTSICLPGRDFTQPTPFKEDNSDAEAEVFVKDLENAFGAVDFSTLKVLQFVPPERVSELYSQERNQDNMKRQAAPFGPDEVRSIIALFTVDGKICVLCCDTMRYGDRWFMYKPGGNIGAIAGLNVLTGGVIAIPPEKFVAILKALESDTLAGLDTILRDLMLTP